MKILKITRVFSSSGVESLNYTKCDISCQTVVPDLKIPESHFQSARDRFIDVQLQLLLKQKLMCSSEQLCLRGFEALKHFRLC